MKKVLELLSVLLVLAGNAYATTILPINLVQLSQRASVIVKGTVTDLRVVEENEKIVSYVTLSDADWIKGDATSDHTYIFSQLAPVAGGFGVNADLPEYRLGKTYVFFLPTAEDGPVAPIGGAQGVFSVKNGEIPDLASRRKLLRKNLPDASLSANAALLQKNLSDSCPDISYATFKSTITAGLNLP